MFSMVHRSTPWNKADKKKRPSDGNYPPQTVPLLMYEKLQLQLMETIDTLSERDSEVSSLASQVKVQTANASAFTYKIESLENTIKEKDSEIEKLKQELSVLRGSGPSTLQDSKPQDTKKDKKEREKKEKERKDKEKKSKRQAKSKSNHASSSQGVKKSGQKKRSRKRITLHNHELSAPDEARLLAISRHASAGTDSEDDSSNQGKTVSTKPMEAQNEEAETPEEAETHPEEVDANSAGDMKEEPCDDSMHSHLCFSSPAQGFRSNSNRRRTLPPSQRFWNFRPSRLPSPMTDRPILDPAKLEMIDEVSDLTRSFRSELSISLWSPSPVVKRREITLSDNDKAAIGFNILPSLPLVDEQAESSLDNGKHDLVVKLGRSNSAKRWQGDEISTVEEESIEEESIEEEITEAEIIEESDRFITGESGDISRYEDILEDDSIASSSMSC
mmetsp:Transcript_21939/g.54194  ORF Transcript_21939/g.54194 Transcript_21939/m.54194 type:complete len:445 (-) Transcript_21939:50-1384(-)